MAESPSQPKMLGRLPALDTGIDDNVTQNRRRRRHDVDDKISSLEVLVAQLTAENEEIRGDVGFLYERMELLEKVFMFVNFDELQKSIDKIAHLRIEPSAKAPSPSVARSGNPGGNIATRSIAVIQSGSVHQDTEHVATSPAKPSLHKSIPEGWATSGEEGRRAEELSMESLAHSPGSIGQDHETHSKLSPHRSKAQTLSGSMITKVGTNVHTGKASNTEMSDAGHASGTGMHSSSAIHSPARSKCYEYAEKYRERFGPNSTLPSFIFERLRKDGMGDDEIDSIGKVSRETKPSDKSFH